MDCVSVTTSGADTAVPSTRDSAMNVVSGASDLATWTAMHVSAMPTDASSANVSALQTGVMRTAASMPDNVIQNARTDVSDPPTLTVLTVLVTQPVKILHTDVFVTNGILDQTVATTWDHVSQHATAVMDQRKQHLASIRTTVSVKSV